MLCEMDKFTEKKIGREMRINALRWYSVIWQQLVSSLRLSRQIGNVLNFFLWSYILPSLRDSLKLCRHQNFSSQIKLVWYGKLFAMWQRTHVLCAPTVLVYFVNCSTISFFFFWSVVVLYLVGSRSFV